MRQEAAREEFTPPVQGVAVQPQRPQPVEQAAQLDVQGLLGALYERISMLEQQAALKGDQIDELHLTIPCDLKEQKLVRKNY